MRTERTNDWSKLLVSACDIPSWDKATKTWKSVDGNWYSLSAEKKQGLKESIETLTKIARLGMDRQWIIVSEGLDFIKNILSSPLSGRTQNEISLLTWQLMFELICRNPENQKTVWNECKELLFQQMMGYKNDICRLVLFNIYAIGGYGAQEGLRIMQMLLNSSTREKQIRPLSEQPLTCFLEHFINDEKNITVIYLNLNRIEKIALSQFIVDYFNRPLVEGVRNINISMDLRFNIINDFISKSELILASPVQDDSDIQELLAFFEVIAHFSAEESFQMNTFDFALLRNMVRLFCYVRSRGAAAEAIFATVKRNSNRPLTHITLATISNLVKENHDHKDMAREAGLIPILVDFVAKETDRPMYRCILFALIDMCQTSPISMQLVEQIAKSQQFTGTEAVETFLYDMAYKGRRNFD